MNRPRVPDPNIEPLLREAGENEFEATTGHIDRPGSEQPGLPGEQPTPDPAGHSRRSVLRRAGAFLVQTPVALRVGEATITTFATAGALVEREQLLVAQRQLAAYRQENAVQLASDAFIYCSGPAEVFKGAGLDPDQTPNYMPDSTLVAKLAGEIASADTLRKDPLAAFNHAYAALTATRQQATKGGGSFNPMDLFAAAGLAHAQDSSASDPTWGAYLSYLQTAQAVLGDLPNLSYLLQSDNDQQENAANIIMTRAYVLAVQTHADISDEAMAGMQLPNESSPVISFRLPSAIQQVAASLKAIADGIQDYAPTVVRTPNVGQ